MINVEDLQVKSYILDRHDNIEMVTLERVPQDDGNDRWAIRFGGMCLNKNGEFEMEPMPSSRTGEFFERCRFDNALLLLSIWESKGKNWFCRKYKHA